MLSGGERRPDNGWRPPGGSRLDDYPTRRPNVAQFPCTRCGKRYRGPQQTLYPAIVDGADADRAKVRLCQDCLREVGAWMEQRMLPAEAPDAVTLCSACGTPDPTLAVFVTLYRAGKDREDWFGRLHDGECRVAVQDALFGAAVTA